MNRAASRRRYRTLLDNLPNDRSLPRQRDTRWACMRMPVRTIRETSSPLDRALRSSRSDVVSTVAFSLQPAGSWEVLACLRVLVGRCRWEAWHWWENCRVLQHPHACNTWPFSSGRAPQGLRDVQIVMIQPMDACRGRQQALRAILQLLTQVGRSFAFWVDNDLSDCSEG